MFNQNIRIRRGGMRDLFVGSRIMLLAAFFLILPILKFVSEGNCFLKGDINNDDKIDLTETIHSLQVTSGTRTALSSKTINVPEDIPTIQAAIDSAGEGDIINIAAGIYNESLTISTNRITLQGASKESTIIDGGGQDIITIDGSQRIYIAGVALKNGNDGILGKPGSMFTVKDVVIQDCADDGIELYGNSGAGFDDLSVLRSGDAGIWLTQNSTGVFLGSVISNDNGNTGIMIFGSSDATFVGATITISNNGGSGIIVSGSSSLFSNNSTVTLQNNVRDGIGILGGSHLQLNENDTWLAQNNLRGLVVAGGSWLVMRSTTRLTVNGNSLRGIQIAENANAEIQGIVTVENNSNYGIFIDTGASIAIFNTASLTVKGIQGGEGIGILIMDNSSLNAWGGLY